MGIPIGGGRNRRRRSYADYRPSPRRSGPRSDPFRILLYLLVIGAAVWLILNPDFIKQQLAGAISSVSPEAGEEAAASILATSTPTPDPASYAGLAQQAYAAGNYDEAIEYYRLAGEHSPNTIDYPLQAARLLLFRSSLEYGEKRLATLEEALDAANHAILADPFHPGGYAMLGKIKDWQEMPEEGLNDIQRALEADETYAPAHADLAEVMVDLQRWEQAQASIEYAISLDPNNADIRRDYAYILESLSDYEGAVQQYEMAIQLEPNLPHLQLALARAYRVTGRYQEALDTLFALEPKLPGNALLPYEVGRTYEAYFGDPNSAMQYYQIAVDLDENYASPWVRIGTLRYMEGDYTAAIQAFERAVALDVESADMFTQLGMAYINTGQCGDAIPHLQEARTLAEDDERILDLVNSGFELCAEPIPTEEEEDSG